MYDFKLIIHIYKNEEFIEINIIVKQKRRISLSKNSINNALFQYNVSISDFYSA